MSMFLYALLLHKNASLCSNRIFLKRTSKKQSNSNQHSALLIIHKPCRKWCTCIPIMRSLTDRILTLHTVLKQKLQEHITQFLPRPLISLAFPLSPKLPNSVMDPWKQRTPTVFLTCHILRSNLNYSEAPPGPGAGLAAHIGQIRIPGGVGGSARRWYGRDAWPMSFVGWGDAADVIP